MIRWLAIVCLFVCVQIASAAGAAPLAAVDHVRFYPAPGDRAKAMLGGRFAGSNVSQSQGYVELVKITQAPKPDAWTDLRFDSKTPYRWVRYEAPNGSHGNVGKVEFYQGDRRLNGAGFGSAGVAAPGGPWRTVFDVRMQTWFNSEIADGQYVGLDLRDAAAAPHPVFDPIPAFYPDAKTVTIKSPSQGAIIRYTLDGTLPTASNGIDYTGPIHVDKLATIEAVATVKGMAPSTETIGTYYIGAEPKPLNTFHVGNSLTGNAIRFRVFFPTAGAAPNLQAFLMGGAFTVKLWAHKDGDQKQVWAKDWAAAAHPLAHFTMQPRDFNIDEEVQCEENFLKLVREKSPDVQPWLYAEWVERDRHRPSDRGEVPSYQMSKLYPAGTWEESMSAMMLYVEQVQHQLQIIDHGNKPVRILPCGVAMGLVRSLVDSNQFPGVAPGETSYYHVFFDDDNVHVSAAGCYLVDLVWYSAFFKESPEGKVLPITTGLTSEQAKILQRLAWDIVKNYPDCGLYEEGTTPTAAPRFERESAPSSVIHLTSATPGAFFRYTLDGSAPTRTKGYIYCGAITARPGVAIKAIAFKSGNADSTIAELTPEEGKK